MIEVDRLWRVLASATPYELAVNVPYALAIALVAAEVAWIARRPPDRAPILRASATAAGMLAGALVVGVLYTAVLRSLWTLFAWDRAAAFWHDHAVVGAAATFVAWDIAGWAYHLIGH